ncbi:MAG: hypothetical protein V7K25_13630 [Nostoc sp.]|uniref:WD40 repeat domain-containing protein n=1 Tax=Nostoc sp. TaxID=1180 RepID=UPI002FFA0128
MVNPDWKTIISDDRYGNLRTYDFWTGEEIFSFQGDSSALAFTPDGKVLFSATCKTPYSTNARIEINVIESSTGQLLRTLLFANAYLPIRCLLASPDGSILVAQALDLLTQVWDWQNGQVLSTFNALPSSSSLDSPSSVCRHWLDTVATRPNGQIIAGVAQRDKPSEETTVAIWDIQTTEVLYTLGIGIRRYFCTTIFAVAVLENIDRYFLLLRGKLQSVFQHLIESTHDRIRLSTALRNSIVSKSLTNS